VVPFVVQLLGEYVAEIAEVIEAHLGGLSRHLYAEFFRENPSFVALTQTRAMSYWNCYYRFPWHDRHWRRATRGVSGAARPRGDEVVGVTCTVRRRHATAGPIRHTSANQLQGS